MGHCTGITSTYVENTAFYNFCALFGQDHLHIRGEYAGEQIVEMADLGSPPHTWRIHVLWVRQRKQFRITSTYVENTLKDPLSLSHF